MAKLGNIKHLKIELKSPLNLNFEGDLQQITMLVGPNASGKTLVNKLTWAGTFTMIQFIMHKFEPSYNLPHYVFSRTFRNFEEFDGFIEYEFDNGGMAIEIKEGKVSSTSLKIPEDEELEPAGIPVYMSADMRTFEAMQKYIDMRDVMGIKNKSSEFDEQDNAKMSKMDKYYHLYDIVYCEMFIDKFHNGLEINENLRKRMLEFDDSFKAIDIKKIGVELYSNPELWYTTGASDKPKDLRTLGKGHQSLINMFLGTEIISK